MKPRVYLETTIPSYLTAWPSRDLVRAAHQQMTREWWDRRDDDELFVSQLVLRECRAGDPNAAASRLAVLQGLQILEHSAEVDAFASELRRHVPLPERAATDSIHIAAAATHAMDYLLTWNCIHIANAKVRRRIENVCRSAGLKPPTICTPYDLLGREPMIKDDLIREIREVREEYSRQFDNDIGGICRDLREQERTSGRQVVSFPPRRPSSTLRADAADSTASTNSGRN